MLKYAVLHKMEVDFSVIECICNIAEKYEPDYDIGKIYEKIEK